MLCYSKIHNVALQSNILDATHCWPVSILLITLLIESTTQAGPAAKLTGKLGEANDTQAVRRNKLSQSDHLELINRSMGLFADKTLIVSVVVREPFVIFNAPPPIKRFHQGVEGFNNLGGQNSHNYSQELREQQLSDLDNYSGVAIEVLKRLASVFKFNIRITHPKDKQFGVYSSKLRGWTGLMGDLTRREADIGLTALSITMSRAQVIDFTRAYYVETAAVLLRIPEEVQNYLAIFEPFSSAVWCLLLATIMLLIFLITIMTKLEDNQLQQEKAHKLMKSLRVAMTRAADVAVEEKGEPTDRHEFSSSFPCASSPSSPTQVATERDQQQQQDEYLASNRSRLRRRHSSQAQFEQMRETKAGHEFGTNWLERFYYAVSCVVNILLIRDIKHPPHQSPIRILVCVWWLSTIVIVNIYLGILFGQLVVPRRPKSIETLSELVGQNQIAWAVTRGSAISDLFEKSDPNTVYGQLGQRMQQVSTADEGVGRVVDSGWAFIRERSIVTFKVAQEHNRLRACRMQFAREEFYSVGFGLGLVKGSKYLKAFDAALTLMIENGFVSRWQSMYWPRRNQYTECRLQPAEGQPLSLKHFISIYLVCSLIVCLSLAILIYQSFHEHLLTTRLKPLWGRFKGRLLRVSMQL